MLRRVAFAPAIVVLLSMCSKTENVTEAVSDSTAQVSDNFSSLLPTFVYDRTATLEGQFAEKLNSAADDTISLEGFLALSETITLHEKSNLLIKGGDYVELKLVMFREHSPILKLTACKNITFSNVSFTSQYTFQSLVELNNCSDITFEKCTFMFDQGQAIAQSNSTNIAFNGCTFGGLPYSNAEEPTLEEQADESYDGEVEGEEGGETTDEADELYETEATEGNTNEYVSSEPPTFPTESWSSPMSTLSIVRQQQNLNYFASNPFFTIKNNSQMNFASYSALEFGRDFFTPVDWAKESETWQEGSAMEENMPTGCSDFAKVLSLTRTRRKLWYIHRKLSLEQESGVNKNDRWRDDTWYQNRSYFYYLFTNRSSTFIEGVWREAIPYLSGEVTISKSEYSDALLFIDELLLYYAKVKATPFWEDRYSYLRSMEVNLSSGDYFHQAGFPVHANVCMRNGSTGGNYITGYDWGNEAWMYGFWLRRHKEGNMDVVKDILLWAKAEISKRS